MRIADGLRGTLREVAPIGLILLASAALATKEALIWPRGLWFVGVYFAISMISNVALATYRPDGFKVRQQAIVDAKDKAQPLIDAIGSAFYLAYGCAWLAFISVDGFRLHLLPKPGPAISLAGGAVAVVGLSIRSLAVWQNRYAAPNVQNQAATAQTVIDTGVYAWIRHPIYAGNLLLFFGAALWLESYSALIFAVGFVVFTCGRIAVEERYMRANLPGYIDYARRVPGRVIPHVL